MSRRKAFRPAAWVWPRIVALEGRRHLGIVWHGRSCPAVRRRTAGQGPPCHKEASGGGGQGDTGMADKAGQDRRFGTLPVPLIGPAARIIDGRLVVAGGAPRGFDPQPAVWAQTLSP